MLFLDTSALVKLVYAEAGSDLAQTLWDGADLFYASWLAYPEAVGALEAGRRGRRITREQLGTARRDLDRLWEEIDAVEVTEQVGTSAGDAAARYGLRGADAVHLASAALLRSPELVLATWDRVLARAAAEAGIAVTPALR